MSDDVKSDSWWRRLLSAENGLDSLAQVFGWSGRTTFIVSLLFTAAVFTLCAFAYRAHGLNDDWALSNALSGRWGDPQGITLFLNALMCQIVYGLNTSVGGPNWFFVLELCTAYLAFLAITYMALRWSSPLLGVLTVASFVALVLPGCTWESNFTFVAFGACCAGLMMLLFSLARPRHSAALVVPGLLFVFVGILWRANIFLVAIPVCGLAALFQVVLNVRGSGRAPLGKAVLRLWPFAVALLFLGGLLLYHGAVWGDPAYDDWYQYNEVRSTFSDYPKKSYDDIADEMAGIGVSETDFEMLSGWMTEDPDFFTTDLIAKVNGIALKSNDVSAGRVAYTFARYGYRVVKDVPLAVFVVLVLVCALLTLNRRGKVFATCLVLLAVVMGTAFLVVGRMPDRVNYPLWLYVFGSVCALSGNRGATERDAAGAHARMGSARRPLLCAAAVACIAASIAFPVLTLRTAVTSLCPQRVQAIVAPESFDARSDLLDYIQDNPDAVVVMNTGSYFDIVYANLMVAPCSEQATAHVIGLGGWGTRSPYANGRNLRADMANPLKGLVDNGNAVYVAASDKTAKLIRSYLQEHYYPDVSFSQVDTLDSYDGEEGALLVFKFERTV